VQSMQVFTGLLILAGAGILGLSLFETNRILRILPAGAFKHRWRILARLTVFFLVGYLISFCLAVLDQTNTLALMTGVIFLGGGCFVYLVAQVSQRTFNDLITTTVSKSYFDNIIQSMADALIVTDANLTITMVNQKAIELTGYEERELTQKKVSFLLKNPEFSDLPHRDVENMILTRDGRSIPIILSSSIIAAGDGQQAGIVHTLRDITYHKKLETELIHRASHDAQTGLPNRSHIVRHLERVLWDPTAVPPPSLAVMFLDLDNFKDVNDSLGHAAGDLILAMISRKLEKCIRTGDIIGRLGGDEFVILIENFLSREETIQVCERILKELQVPMQVLGHEIKLSASVGVALSGSELRTAGEILKAADIAMYEAKKHGKARYEFYHPSMKYIERVI
jgi:diguanylate cyclase (GGDEF)-like protein/PAS domain S-box-containing protein